MTDDKLSIDNNKHDDDNNASATTHGVADAAPRATRRGFLTGMALLGASAAAGDALAAEAVKNAPGEPALAPDSLEFTRALRRHVKNVVVIYAENRSFNNLFGDFPGVEQPLSSLTSSEFRQVDRDGTPLATLPPVWGGMVPNAQVVNHANYQVKQDAPYMNDQPNEPFPLRGPQGEYLPQGVVTRDLWHLFYQNQMQINGGKNDRFVAWADAGALVMGYYADNAYNLRLWKLAQEFVLCDRFFQGAFGGSFLNHQYLVAARPPFYPDASRSPARTQIATLESDDPADPRLKPIAGQSPTSAMQGPPVFGPSALTPDGYAVNTMMPPYWPTRGPRDPRNSALADLANPNVMVPQDHAHIGDLLDAKGVAWAWYSGGWQAAITALPDTPDFPAAPNFQYHHQPLNYYRNLGPDFPEQRATRLRDGGLGDMPDTNRFLADVEAGRLPAVAIYKPQGNLNMHAGYADVEAGDRHIAHLIDSLRRGPQWNDMVVIITVDENGGWWDHIAPPKGDRWGPGSRVPALIVSPYAKQGVVDHTVYDTGSILRFITRVFDLPLLEGLQLRDEAMQARGQKPMGDLTNALTFSA
ncbi:MAG: acid phosphatase [Pseudomonadales bacterium]|jgi:acid phosphatase|nr:acid phosphatase [Pseudomonadales bacterium]